MSLDDQFIFNIDPTSLEWTPFFVNLTLGVRKYLHKENEDTLQKALDKHFM